MERKTIHATVDKISGTQTARVFVTSSVIHPIYSKRYAKTRRLLVDTTKHEVHIGDVVEISEVKPISKNKSWVVDSVVTHATLTEEKAVTKTARKKQS